MKCLTAACLLLLSSNALGSGIRRGSSGNEHERKLALRSVDASSSDMDESIGNLSDNEQDPMEIQESGENDWPSLETQLKDEIDELASRIADLEDDNAQLWSDVEESIENPFNHEQDPIEIQEDGENNSPPAPDGSVSVGMQRSYYSYYQYSKYRNKGCRTYHGGKGSSHHEFDLYYHVSRATCERKCNGLGRHCYGYEYSHSGKCEVWRVPIHKTQYVNGLDCYIRH